MVKRTQLDKMTTHTSKMDDLKKFVDALASRRVAVGFMGRSALAIPTDTVGKTGLSGAMPESLKKSFQKLEGSGTTGRKAGRRNKGKASGKSAKIRNIDKAVIHHFGAPNANIPPRPFMGLMGDRMKFKRLIRKRYHIEREKILKGGRSPLAAADAIYAFVGLAMEDKIRQRIIDLQTPPLAEVTKAQRLITRGDASPNPLVDTGQMVQSVTSKVEDNR